MDLLELLARSVDQTGSIVARVKPDQAELPTPCSEWNVRALVNHTVYDLHVFTAMVAGGERGSPDVDLIDDDWPGAYRAAADTLLDTWRRVGLDRTIQLPWGEYPASWQAGQHITNMAVHAWDLARATGQSTDLDPEVGQFALEWGRENLKPQFRGQAFGPEVDVPTTAPLYDRLAGVFGRDPS
jgi:uncharacterized protein (TIGR03086 family)